MERSTSIAGNSQIEAEIPTGGRGVAVLDNLSTHKTTEVQDWLVEHPRW